MPAMLKEWWPLLIFLFPVLLACVGWAIRKGLASKDDLAAETKARSEKLSELEERVDGRLADLDRRTLRIETEVKHLPTDKDFNELKSQMAKVVASTEGLSRSIESIDRAVTRVEDHMLKQASGT